MKSWHPPLLLAIVMGAAVAGFALGGPGPGIALAGLSLVAFVVLVLRAAPEERIGRLPHPESARRILIASTVPIEDRDTVEKLADEIGLGGISEEAEIRILTPARPDFLARWATDLARARERAQRDLVISVATLALSGVAAGASVGDQDMFQAIEDQLAEFDATEVFLVTQWRGRRLEDVTGRLSSRLAPPLGVIEVDPGSDANPLH